MAIKRVICHKMAICHLQTHEFEEKLKILGHFLSKISGKLRQRTNRHLGRVISVSEFACLRLGAYDLTQRLRPGVQSSAVRTQ